MLKKSSLENILSEGLYEIWALLTPEEKRRLTDNFVIHNFKRNQIIYAEGDDPEYLWCLLSGKVKKFKDAEYIVEGVETGKVVYNEDGMKEYDVVRAIIIDHKGTKVHVGSGLSKEQRIEWFKDPSLIIGKTVTVQYFQESKNMANDGLSLRFPVLKYVYEDGRNI